MTHGRALASVCVVLCLTFLDTTIVSVSLASVQSDLHAGVTALQWVVNGYTLAFACLMLLGGAAGDRLGHKQVMLAGVVVFVAGSLVAVFAGSAGQVIVGRVVMGVGAACCEPATLAVVRDLYPDRAERTRALGVWAAVSGLALAFGPVVGGLLVGQWGWVGIFWFNVVVGVAGLVVVAAWVPDTGIRSRAAVDLVGFGLTAVFLFCAVYGVIAGESAGYSTWWVIGLFVLAALAVLCLMVVERRSAQPMLDPAYLRIPLVRSALVVAFAVYFGIFAIFFFTALYLQEVLSYSSWRLAGLFAPMAVAIVVAALATGAWLGHRRAMIPMVAGCLISALGIAGARLLLDEHPVFALMLVALVVCGAGFGMAVVPLTAVVLGQAPPDHAGLAAAMTNTMRQVGAVVGVAALGAMVNAHLTTDLTHRLTQIGVPNAMQGLVTAAIEQGTVPTNGAPQAAATYGSIVQRVIGATFGAFRDGLHQALLVAALLLVLAAVYTVVANRHPMPSLGSEPEASRH